MFAIHLWALTVVVVVIGDARITVHCMVAAFQWNINICPLFLQVGSCRLQTRAPDRGGRDPVQGRRGGPKWQLVGDEAGGASARPSLLLGCQSEARVGEGLSLRQDV